MVKVIYLKKRKRKMKNGKICAPSNKHESDYKVSVILNVFTDFTSDESLCVLCIITQLLFGSKKVCRKIKVRFS